MALTHGETWFKIKQNLLDCKLCDIRAVNDSELPARMGKKLAGKHYNIRLFLHWVNDYDYDARLSLKRRKEIVSALMFGNSQYYKKFKELISDKEKI